MEGTNRFKAFIESIFMSTEDEKPVEKVELSTEEVIDEVKGVVEDVAEIAVQNTEDIAEIKEELETEAPADVYTKAEVDTLIEDAVTATVEALTLAREGALKKTNEDLSARLEKLELELQKPAKEVEKVIPPTKGEKKEYWSMADAVKRNK